MAMELVIYGVRQFGIKEYPSRASWVLRRGVKEHLGIYDGSTGISYGGLSYGEVVRPT